MLHYLIKVTDNTLPIVIVLAFLLALMTRTPEGVDKKSRNKKTWAWGILPGALAALVYAVLKRNTGIAVREYYDLGVLLPSLALTLGMLAALWRIFSPRNSPGPLGQTLVALLLAAWMAYILPNLLLYPFEFAVGMESIYNTEFLFRVMGYIFGLLVMFLLGLGLYKTASKMPARLVMFFFAALLLILLAKQGLEVAQILVARGMIPRYRWLMSAVMFILTHVNWFSFALMALAFLATAALVARVRLEPLRGGNPAIIRKQKAGQRTQMRYSVVVLVCLALSVLTITSIRSYANREVEISPPLEIAAEDGKVIIPLEQISDGNLHRFVHKTPDGVDIRYIVIKKSETAYGVGLDACDICGPSGYYQRKDQVICKLCDVVMNISTIGFPGGCNPVPLRFSVSRGAMVIPAKDLDAEQQRFR